MWHTLAISRSLVDSSITPKLILVSLSVDISFVRLGVSVSKPKPFYGAPFHSLLGCIPQWTDVQQSLATLFT